MAAQSLLVATPHQGQLDEIDELSTEFSSISLDEAGKIVKCNRVLCWKSLISEAAILLNFVHPYLVAVERIHFFKDDQDEVHIQYVLPHLRPFDMEVMFDWPKSKIRRVCYQIIDAMAFLQEHGIYHGDIKASNLLLDDNDNAILSDFGLMFYNFNDSACYETQSYVDDGKLEYISHVSNTYDKLATAMFCLGILLFHILIPENEIPDMGDPAVVVCAVFDPSIFVDNWIQQTPEHNHLIDVVKRLLGPISNRPKTFTELLHPDYVRQPGLYHFSTFEQKRVNIAKVIPRDVFAIAVANLYNTVEKCGNNLTTFELAVEIFAQFYFDIYFPRQDSITLEDYIYVCCHVAQMVYLEKNVCLLASTSVDVMMALLRRANFNFHMTLRTTIWRERSSLCWYFAVLFPELWRHDILDEVDTICRQLNIPTFPSDETILPDWLSKFVRSFPRTHPNILVYLNDMPGCMTFPTDTL